MSTFGLAIVATAATVELSASGSRSAATAAGAVPVWLPQAPMALVLDDGTAENNIGVGGTIEFLWLNRFTPDPALFPFNITTVSVYFDSTSLATVGDNIRIVLFANTSGNTDPAVGATHLASFPTTVQALDAWNDFTLPTPVLFSGPGDVLVGVIALETPGTSYWPAAIDQTASLGRSWAGWYAASPPPDPATLPPDSMWISIDSFFPGNWMIRASGVTVAQHVAVPTTGWLALAAMILLLTAGAFVALRRLG